MSHSQGDPCGQRDKCLGVRGTSSGPSCTPPVTGQVEGWGQLGHGGMARGGRGSGPPPTRASPPSGSPVFASADPIPGWVQDRPWGPAPLSLPPSPAHPVQPDPGRRVRSFSSTLCVSGQSPTVPSPVSDPLLSYPCQPGDSPVPALPQGPPLPFVPAYRWRQGQPHACCLHGGGTGCWPQSHRYPGAPRLGWMPGIILSSVLCFALVP